MQISSHKWLGLRWSVSGEWMQHVTVTVAACSSMVNLLCSFMDYFRVPLAVVAVLFELKVEATLRFGRWLWGLFSEVQCFLTTTYENWARQFLGAKPWNNAASCQADLSWTFDASDRIAFDIASVRQRLWKVPLLVVFSVQGMFLIFPHGHPFLVNFLSAKISLTGPLR